MVTQYYMFEGIGIEWGMTFLGCVAALFIPMPFLLYKYGKTLRARSKFAPAPDIEMEKRRDEESKGQADTENENENHADKHSRLLHVGAHALVAHDADAVAGRKTRHADREAAGQVHEAAVQAVRLRGRVHVFDDEDGDDERVDGDDTGHDDGNQALQPGRGRGERPCQQRSRTGRSRGFRPREYGICSPS